MSLTGKTWQLYKPEKELSSKLAERSNISPVTAQVLINRGITSAPDIDSFFNPKLSSLFDPAEMPDMAKAAKRVKLAKERGEKVAVYGDYDVDGVTGTAILLLALKKLGIEADYYIPHRYKEGYGMNIDAVSQLRSKGIDLIITVDCGISNLIEVEHANSLGMEVIITDHHNVPKSKPKAYAIVNPKLTDGKHGSRDLSGAGVAFKFAWGLFRAFGINDSKDLTAMLDLAGLGTIADIVPLIDENRVLAVHGLKALNERKRAGLRALMDVARVNGKLTADSIGFMISPRINAAGRIEHASLSVELLTTEDQNRIRELAGILDKINSKRQDIGSQIKEDVFSRIAGIPPKLIVLEGKDWHPGVIGIVASKVVDQFCRPAILIGVTDGVGRGSARSIDGLDIYSVLEECRDLFLDFGGHKKAAGFEIEKDKIPEFKKRVIDIVDERLTSEDLKPRLLIDTELNPGQINISLAMELQSLDPFGEGNPEPLLMTRNLKLIEQRRVGDGSHIKARFTDGKVTLDSIGFRLGDMSESLKLGNKYDIVYCLRLNEYNGIGSAQLNLVDIRDYNS